MSDITTRSRWLFWGFLIAIFLLSVAPSAVLIDKLESYYRFLSGFDPGTLRQLKMDYVPHREGGYVPESPEIRYAQFKLSAPQAKAVRLAGSFNQWQPLALKRGADGTWKVLLPLPRGTYYYAFDVDGAWTLDPSTPRHVPVAGKEASVREIP